MFRFIFYVLKDQRNSTAKLHRKSFFPFFTRELSVCLFVCLTFIILISFFRRFQNQFSFLNRFFFWRSSLSRKGEKAEEGAENGGGNVTKMEY